MKKIIISICIFFFLTSCIDEKENYIKDNFPKVFNLESSELTSFKESMIFNEDGILNSWDGELLEKVYPDEDEKGFVLLKIYNKLGINLSKIVIIDKDNNERTVQPGLYDINGKRIPLFHIQKMNAIFYITSTNCGFCLESFKKMNEISNKYKEKGMKFVAIFEKVKNIDNYKNGDTYKEEGFLNDDWIILQKNIFTPFLTEKYNDSLGFPFVFFRKDGGDLGKYPKAKDYAEIENILDTF